VSDYQSLLGELEHAISGTDVGYKAGILRRVADLFVSASANLSDEQVALFGDVMSQLINEIDTSARATFGRFLTTVRDAPPKIFRQLALDDSIDVAGPILSSSQKLDEQTLVEGARTKSQAHLLAISGRKRLAEPVTDVLVERGNQEVVLCTAGNLGAEFSEFGYSTLVQRSSCDANLAVCVWSRPEIPRQHLLKLFADASESVMREFTSKNPHRAGMIHEIVAQASSQIQTRTRETSTRYTSAHSYVLSLYESGKLDERLLTGC
jgi:uncharacterized protein (DUF2336 family)